MSLCLIDNMENAKLHLDIHNLSHFIEKSHENINKNDWKVTTRMQVDRIYIVDHEAL